MRIFPAHLREAKEMARALCDAFDHLGLPRDWRDPEAGPPTLQQTQELMANAMGYAGWRELSRLVQQAHVPVYLDTIKDEDSGAATTKLATALSFQVGLDYAHGHIWNALQIAGVGFSPKRRRSLAENSTPWGVIEEEHEPIAEGIRSVSTSGHGGWLLSPERQAKMPQHLRNPDGAYEEDGEFHLVALAFPEEAHTIGVSMREALSYLGILDTTPERQEQGQLLPAPVNSGQDHRAVEATTLTEPPLSQMEARVIDYLASCVRANRIPIRFPSESKTQIKNLMYHARSGFPSKLEDWVELLASVPTIDGSWATRPGPWYDHWDWRVRTDQEEQAREEGEAELFQAPTS